MPSGKELRYQILKYLLAREHSGEASIAETSEVATDLGVNEQDILNQIDVLESKGAIIANRTFSSAAPMLTGAGKALLEELEESEDAQGITESVEETISLSAGYARPSRDEFEWDAFICHATEDKDVFVRDLATELLKKGIRVWFDEFSLKVGDSLRESIERGILESRFGIVVLSTSFFNKNWPQRELSALMSKDARNQKMILPVWLDVNYEIVKQQNLLLADIIAARAEEGLEKVVAQLIQVLK